MRGLIITALAATVLAQAPQIPTCAQGCVSQLSGYGGCGATDIKCICSNQAFLSDITCCVGRSCEAAQVPGVISFAKGLCSAAGVTNLPTTLPTAASCSRGATAAAASGTSSSSGSRSGSSTATTSGGMSSMTGSGTSTMTGTDSMASGDMASTASDASASASATESGAANKFGSGFVGAAAAVAMGGLAVL